MSVTEKEVDRSAVETVEEVEEPTVDSVGQMVLNAEEVDAAMQNIADTADVDDFTAPRSNVNHGHGPDKHDVREEYNVRDEFVEEFFGEHGIAPNDHAALWLLSCRKEEAINHEEKVFEDTPDTNQARWGKIESIRSAAPIAPETQRALQK